MQEKDSAGNMHIQNTRGARMKTARWKSKSLECGWKEGVILSIFLKCQGASSEGFQ